MLGTRTVYKRKGSDRIELSIPWVSDDLEETTKIVVVVRTVVVRIATIDVWVAIIVVVIVSRCTSEV